MFNAGQKVGGGGYPDLSGSTTKKMQKSYICDGH